MAAAMAENVEGFLRGLMDANLALAGKAANLRAVLAQLSASFLDELRWTLVARSRDPEADLRTRIDAGLALGWLGDPRFERLVGSFGEYLMPPMVRGSRQIQFLWRAGSRRALIVLPAPPAMVRCRMTKPAPPSPAARPA